MTTKTNPAWKTDYRLVKAERAAIFMDLSEAKKRKELSAEDVILFEDRLETVFDTSELKDYVLSDLAIEKFANILEKNTEPAKKTAIINDLEKSRKELEVLKAQIREKKKENLEAQKMTRENQERRSQIENVYEELKNRINEFEQNYNIEITLNNPEVKTRLKDVNIAELARRISDDNLSLDSIKSIEDDLVEKEKEFNSIEKAFLGSLNKSQPVSGFGSISGKKNKGLDTKEASDFLEAVEDSIAELQRGITRFVSQMQVRLRDGFNKGDADTLATKIKEHELKVKEKEAELRNATEDLNLKKNMNVRLYNEERAVSDAKRNLAEAQSKLEGFKAQSSKYMNIDLKLFTGDFDNTLAAVRRYQQDLRNALKDSNVNDIGDNETKEKIRQAVAGMFQNALIFSTTENKIHTGFLDYVALRSQDLSSIPNSGRETFSFLRSLASDNVTEIEISLTAIHREILKAIEIDKEGFTKNTSAMTMLYLFKSLRVAASWLAFYLADKLFKEYYKKNKNATQPKTVDLRWFVAIYASFQLVFDIIALAVMYFVRRIDPDVVSGSLMLDYAFDATVVTLMLLASSFWVADIIQDKKYFAYRTANSRAVRSLRTIMLWLLILHSLVPYFYIAGPNFTGRSKFKKIDEEVRKKKKERDSKKGAAAKAEKISKEA